MMLYTIIKDNTYQDSIVLMLLSQKLSAMDGGNKASVMMGTPANKDIFKGSGLGTPELETASANDIVIVIDTDDESKVEEVEEAVETELAGCGGSDDSQISSEAHNWQRALERDTSPILALISIPGTYAAMEAESALHNDVHVFMFSDTVRNEDEVRLKEVAHEKGLL